MNNQIDEAIKMAKKSYYKEWRKNNKDKIKKHNQTYWLRKAKKMAAEKEANANKQD